MIKRGQGTRTALALLAASASLLLAATVTAGFGSAGAQESPDGSDEPVERTIFQFFSEPGVLIGTQGTGLGFTSIDVTATLNSDGSVEVISTEDDGDERYRVLVAAPAGETLAIGSYTNAREETSPDPTAPILQFERVALGPPCPESLGMFEILDLEVVDGELVSFAVDFQISCNVTGQGPWSMAAARWSSATEFDSEASPDTRRIEGVITGPDGEPIRDVLACAGIRNESPAQARASGRCITTNRFGEYRLELNLEATGEPPDQGYGEFYVHFFPFAQNYLRHECFSGLGGCETADFINMSKEVHVNSHIDAQLEYGCWEAAATIIADDRSAVVEGTEGDDVIVSFDDDNTIFGLGGDDIICPGNGTNTVFAGDGNDRIFGGIGDDLLAGQLGNDYIWGNLGDDTIRGSDGDDTLLGDSGNDNLSGGRDNDQVDGGLGEDIVRGGTGDDLVLGGPDNDVLVAGNGGVDVVKGGTGDDLLVTGGPRADRVFGDEGNDVAVKGLSGADAVFGGSGDDNLFGGRGTDSLDGGDGEDYCSGGNGFSDRAVDCEEAALVDGA